MSLINEMLRDLEQRQKREERCVPCNETPVVVGGGDASSRFLFYGSGVLLLAGLVWFGVEIIPGMLPEKPIVPNVSAPHQAAVPAVEQTGAASAVQVDASGRTVKEFPAPVMSSPVENGTPAVAEESSTELLSLGVKETGENAQLSLAFAQLPEYRLLQNSNGVAQLVVSFNQTQIGADFEIPQLEGPLLKRVSLVPQKQTLQLLVDLDERATVKSFQLVDDSDQGYRFLIEITATVLAAEKPQKQLLAPEPVSTDAGKIEDPVAAKVRKNPNQLSRDQQAFRAGLEQLKQGNPIAAEVSFNQALLINPELLDARLQLVTLLQQQRQLDKAENFLQQGLSLAPESSDLRKIYARLLLNDQRQGQAIALLKAEPVPGISQDPEYHALLAALYQESEQFVEARSVYGQLVQVLPQEPLWWMGLAISLEHLKNPGQARSAYQQALSLPGLRPDLQNYIYSRLQVL